MYCSICYINFAHAIDDNLKAVKIKAMFVLTSMLLVVRLATSNNYSLVNSSCAVQDTNTLLKVAATCDSDIQGLEVSFTRLMSM